jgi:hypothetical protein
VLQRELFGREPEREKKKKIVNLVSPRIGLKFFNQISRESHNQTR